MKPVDVDITGLYKLFGPFIGTIIVIVLVVIVLGAFLFLMKALKSMGLVPKIFKKDKELPISHYTCPRFPDVLRVIEAVKDFTEKYVTTYILQRHVAVNERMNRRFSYIRSQFLRKISRYLKDNHPDDTESYMRIFRMYSSSLKRLSGETFMRSVRNNHFPRNEIEWEKYKSMQIQYIISDTCDFFRASYPDMLDISCDDISDFFQSQDISGELKNELNKLYDFAKNEAIEVRRKSESSEEELSTLIDNILSGGKNV